jgi:RNA polymerase sigma-70 factor (ECF subfamily)
MSERDGGLHDLIDRLSRRETAQLVAGLTRIFGPAHLNLAEDAVQEALIAALNTWPYRGVPDNPKAWLWKVARNRALDHLRRNAIFAAIEPKVSDWIASLQTPDETMPLADEELCLIVLCCDPQLPEEARVSLTLKSVCGFSVEEIARAFLARPEAIAQRLVRAKARIKELGAAFEMPTRSALVTRIPSVLRTIYLLFNEGYLTSGGDSSMRHDMCTEALRLARFVAGSATTTTPQAHALTALLSFQHARNAARTAADGFIVLLEHQDRRLWDHPLIADGFAHLNRAKDGPLLTALHLEAGIASVHARALSWAETNWSELLQYYDLLMIVAPSPVVALNRAVVVAMIEGAAAALTGIESLTEDSSMQRYLPYHLTVGDLRLKLGERGRARDAYERALGLPASEPEYRLIAEKMRRCADA